MDKRCVNHWPARGASAPTFLRVAMAPYHRGQEENYIAINVQVIQRITPPIVTYTLLPGGGTTTTIYDPRYWVTFRLNGQVESGCVERDDLIAAGLPLPRINGDGPAMPLARARSRLRDQV